MSNRGTITEVYGKEFIEDSSINAKDAKIASKIKSGFECTNESWCKKLKQRNDTSKQTANVSSTSNVGNETNKANAESKSKIITEVVADL